MSLIIGICVDDGIVFAGDRRITMDRVGCMAEIKGETLRGYRYRENGQKLHICENGCVLTNDGAAAIEGVWIEYHISEFLKQSVHRDTDIEEVPKLLVSYFSSFKEVITTHFFVAGYDKTKTKRFYDIYMDTRDIQEYQTDRNFALWSGETWFLDKLMGEVVINQGDGIQIGVPNPSFLIEEFNLYDAVDFARLAIDTSTRLLPYFDAIQSIGGGIDIALITEKETKWLQKKEIL